VGTETAFSSATVASQISQSASSLAIALNSAASLSVALANTATTSTAVTRVISASTATTVNYKTFSFLCSLISKSGLFSLDNALLAGNLQQSSGVIFHMFQIFIFKLKKYVIFLL
jgi:hypothetical protein